MQELVGSLQSPAWWLSVVLAGIVVNLLAAYLKPLLDDWGARRSAARRARRDAQQAEREALLARLASDTHEQTVLLFRELRARLRAVLSLLLATMAMLVYLVAQPRVDLLIVRTLLLVVAAGAAFGSYLEYKKGHDRSRLVKDALRLKHDRSS